MTLIQTKSYSLKQRADSLPKEIDDWLLWAEESEPLEKNSSQLQAIDVFMIQFLDKLNAISSELIELNQTEPLDTPEVLHKAKEVESNINKAQSVWDYFRSKLEQRFDPQISTRLLVADLISHNCYTSVIRKADRLKVKHKLGLRDYPLTYLLVGYSPITSPRGWEISKLNNWMLPIPVIGVPWDQMASPWELLPLHHEVSHDVDFDLNEISTELGTYVNYRLVEEGVPPARARVWERWMTEVFADILGVSLAGPPFVSFLAGFLTSTHNLVYAFSPSRPHPVRYIRILMNCRFVQFRWNSSEMHGYINQVLAEWQAIYGKPPQEIAPYINDFDSVLDKILNTKLDALKDDKGINHSVNNLIDFGENDFEEQLNARDLFISEEKISTKIPIRHIIGAAYMAIEEHLKTVGRLDAEIASTLDTQLMTAVISGAPKGKLPLRPKRSKRYLEELADAYFNMSIE